MDFTPTFRDLVEVFNNNILKWALEDNQKQCERWKELLPSLATWYEGRVDAYKFVIETLDKYLAMTQNQEETC